MSSTACRASLHCRMKRAYRLRKPAQFQRTRREGKKWETSLFALQAAPSRRRATRCGFVTSKRLGNAVVRNRAKRRLREAVRLVYDQIVPGWDLVFIVRTASAEAEFEHLQTTVIQALQRAGCWREQPNEPR